MQCTRLTSENLQHFLEQVWELSAEQRRADAVVGAQAQKLKRTLEHNCITWLFAI